METVTSADRPVVGLALDAPPQKARRLTVGFRAILVIPHLLWSFVLILVGTIVAIVGWFGALFTGRLPEGIADFLGNIVQYSTRVYGYVYLLTDQYPPFALEPRPYPITVILPPRGKLNRAAVLFRVVIGIPAFIVMSVVSSGLQVALVVIWLITLVAGRLPRSAFEAGAATLRYQARAYAWFLMLTSEYPRGLFGDAELAAPSIPGYIPPPPPAPGTIPDPPPAPGAATAAAAPEPPRITALVLSKPGRRLMVTFIVLGILLNVAQIVLSIVVAVTSDQSLRDLDDAYDEVVDASDDYGISMQRCAVAGGASCASSANAEFADAVREFVVDLEGIDFPEVALDDAEDLRDDALATADVLDQMADATADPNAYEGLAGDLQRAITQMDEDYFDLRDTIRFD